MLNQRLGELRDAGLLGLGDAGNALTSIGRELIVAFEPLSRRALRGRSGLG